MRWWKRVGSDVVGMNHRNRELVLRQNPPALIKLANDKLAAKAALSKLGIPLAETIAHVSMQRDFGLLHRLLFERGRGLVMKPAQGAGGRGITIFNGVTEDHYLPVAGLPWTRHQFAYQVCRILHGEFTVGLPVDQVLIEEKLETEADWIVPGLPSPPDLRIIVYQGVSIFAMARLPTLASRGKANLHQGGVGVGIDLEMGHTTHAICRERPIEHHPDSGEVLAGRIVDGLARCIMIAECCAQAVPLGYFGVDLMWDKRRGPCVLEVNARPGLAIQLANRSGLGTALQRGIALRDQKHAVPNMITSEMVTHHA